MAEVYADTDLTPTFCEGEDGQTLIVPGDDAAQAAAAAVSAAAAAAAASASAAAGFQPLTKQPGFSIGSSDNFGRMGWFEQDDGSLYAHDLRRPGPAAGVADQRTVWSELDAAQAAIASLQANAISKTANTSALVSAVRNNAMFPQPLSRVAGVDIPTVTLGSAGAASTLNSRAAGNPLVLMSDARLQWLSGPRVQAGSGAWGSRGAWYGTGRSAQYASFEFVHTGTTMEVAFEGAFYGSVNNLRILVDDRIVWSGSMPSATGSLYYLNLVFGSSRARRIRVEGAAGRFRGINVTSDAEITATGRSYPLVTIMGDSFAEGTGADFVQDGEAVSLVRALGCAVALGAVGGTGILNPGTGGKVAWTDATRLTDLTHSGVTDVLGASVTPAMGIVMMSVNDQGLANAVWSPFGSSFQAAIRDRVFAIIDAWIAANSGKPLVFYGPTWTNGSPVLDIFRIRDGTQEACLAYANQNVWFIDRLNPLPLLRNGTRSYTSTTGTTTSGSAVITGIGTLSGVVAGSSIEGPGIPAGARVMTVDSGTQVTISSNATATATGAALVFRNDHAALYQFGPADTTHPSQQGHVFDALTLAPLTRSLILTEFA